MNCSLFVNITMAEEIQQQRDSIVFNNICIQEHFEILEGDRLPLGEIILNTIYTPSSTHACMEVILLFVEINSTDLPRLIFN